MSSCVACGWIGGRHRNACPVRMARMRELALKKRQLVTQHHGVSAEFQLLVRLPSVETLRRQSFLTPGVIEP